jgi:hypothetical protein
MKLQQRVMRGLPYNNSIVHDLLLFGLRHPPARNSSPWVAQAGEVDYPSFSMILVGNLHTVYGRRLSRLKINVKKNWHGGLKKTVIVFLKV